MTDDMREEVAAVERLIGKIMQIGVLIAALVMAIGLVTFVITGRSGYAAGVHPHTVTAILHGVGQGRPYAVMMLGIFLLILTPVLRVVVSIYAFAKARDRLYTRITTVVLVILVAAMVIGYLGK